MSNADFMLDKQRVRASFQRAAANYDQVAVLQREVGQRMLERLELIRISPSVLVDVGAGTGALTAQLVKRYKKAHVVALDLAPAMVQQARKHKGWFSKQSFVCGDAECLPLATHSIDMIFSNLTLQWCNMLDAAFAEFQRVLKPGGLLLFSTLGPDTLKELRTSWHAADAHTHVNAFLDMHDIGDALVRAGFADPVMDVERLTLTYPTVFQLMSDLKTLGAHNATAGRATGLTGKGRLKKMRDAYELLRRDGVLPASYEVVYGHAWGRVASQGVSAHDGVATFPLNRIRRRTA